MTVPSETAPGAAPTVHELQAMARRAALRRRRRKNRLSRAAQLQLIDLLSRWAGTGLALIAGAAIFIAVAAGRAYPLRAAVWAAIVIAALALCRRLQAQFRAGEKRAAHPFRWRADYTAATAVLSAAFGAGALIALPASAPTEMQVETMAAILCAAVASGLLHAAHGRTAIAASLPAAAFALIAAWRGGGALAAGLVLAASLAGGAALLLIHRFNRERMRRRFPRTGLIRREASAAARTVAPAKAAIR